MKSAIYRYPLVALFCLIAVMQARAAAEERLEKKQEDIFQFLPKGSLKLDNLSGPVKVIGWDKERCEIKAVKSTPVRGSSEKAGKLLEQVSIEIEKTGSRVEISTHYPDRSLHLELGRGLGDDKPVESTGEEQGIIGAWLGQLTSFLAGLGASITNQMSLKMPVDVAYEIHVPRQTDVTVSNAAGDIELSGLDGQHQTNVANGSLRLIKLSGKSEANTVNGEIWVESPGGTFALNTINGRVSVSLEEVYTVKAIRCNTVNGQVDFSLPAGAGASLELTALVGGIEIDEKFKVKGEISAKKVSGKLNDGGPRLEANVVNGGITVSAL